MERIATSQWICVKKIVRFYAVLIIVIVVSMKSFNFVYCFLFGIQVYRFILPFLHALHPQKYSIYFVLQKLGHMNPKVSVPIAVQLFLKPKQDSDYGT